MRALSLLLLTATALLAQADGWPLLRGINPGQHTHVHRIDGKRHSGGFIAATDANIVIRVRTGDQTFARDQIKKVSVRKGSRRWRNAAIGAAIGAATIGILFAANDGGDADSSFIGAAIVAYGLIGAGIGALFPGYDTLYRAPGK